MYRRIKSYASQSASSLSPHTKTSDHGMANGLTHCTDHLHSLFCSFGNIFDLPNHLSISIDPSQPTCAVLAHVKTHIAYFSHLIRHLLRLLGRVRRTTRCLAGYIPDPLACIADYFADVAKLTQSYDRHLSVSLRNVSFW